MVRRAGSGGGGAEELELEIDEEDEVGESTAIAMDGVPRVRGGGRGGGRGGFTASSLGSESGRGFLAGNEGGANTAGFGVNSSASSSSENGLCKLTRESDETERVEDVPESSDFRVCGMEGK